LGLRPWFALLRRALIFFFTLRFDTVHKDTGRRRCRANGAVASGQWSGWVPWLLRDGDVLATLEVATSRRRRGRGLLGRDGIEGALLLDPARSIHTVGMRFAIDVAYCARRADGALVVLEARSMRSHRVGRPRLRARCVIEAEEGAVARWALTPGNVLEVR